MNVGQRGKHKGPISSLLSRLALDLGFGTTTPIRFEAYFFTKNDSDFPFLLRRRVASTDNALEDPFCRHWVTPEPVREAGPKTSDRAMRKVLFSRKTEAVCLLEPSNMGAKKGQCLCLGFPYIQQVVGGGGVFYVILG